jgi:hypothetical protein
MTTLIPLHDESGRARKGCLITLGIVVLILVVASIFVFNLPQRIGLVASPAERFISQTPDREAAVALKAELAKTGISTQGIGIYVLPERNSDQSVLLAVLDSSQGFSFTRVTGQDAITDYLKRLADLDKAGKYRISQVVLDYRDSDSASLVTVTVPVAAVRQFSQGTMSRKDFMQAIEGQVNVAKLAEVGLP